MTDTEIRQAIQETNIEKIREAVVEMVDRQARRMGANTKAYVVDYSMAQVNWATAIRLERLKDIVKKTINANTQRGGGKWN